MSLARLFILRGREPHPCDDLPVWGKFMDNIAGRQVAQGHVAGYAVSTVFLGIDLGTDPARPLVFETVVFDDRGERIETSARLASTNAEALQHHRQAEADVRYAAEVAQQMARA